MSRTTTPSRRARLFGAAVAATAAAGFGALALAGPAGAQQFPSADQTREGCQALGGSWRPGMYGGVEGWGCRIDVAYGCGIDLHYGADGRPLGGDAWCLGFNGSWPAMR